MRNSRNRRSRLAQKRIDYIVFGNPRKARKLLRNYGITPPRKLEDVLPEVKKLIRDKGRKVVKDLIRIHPDKRAVIRIAKKDGEVSYFEEDSFCGSCGEHSYNPSIGVCRTCGTGDSKTYSIDQLLAMPLESLKQHYEGLVAKSNNAPNNIALANQVQQVWNVLRGRINEPKKDEPLEGSITKKHLCILGLTFAAGIMIGSALKS